MVCFFKFLSSNTFLCFSLYHPFRPFTPFVGSLFPLFLFLTYRNSIAASAVCAFNLSAISQVFNGPFKYQENSRSAWLPYPNPNPDFQVTKLLYTALACFFLINSRGTPQTLKQDKYCTTMLVAL